MKLLFDFLPILLFFFAYKFFGIYVATSVAIAATVIQVSLVWLKTKKVEKMHIVTLVMIFLFGGATLLLKDETFIKWKPTVVNWIFGLAFLGSQIFTRKPLVERMMENFVQLPSIIWRRLNIIWGLFFIGLGCANLFVIYRFDTNTWVNFKLFGMMGAMIVFLFLQAIYLSRHTTLEPKSESEE